MAEAALSDFDWDISVPPREGVKWIPKGKLADLSEFHWRGPYFGNKNFTITYPFGRYSEFDPIIPYDAEGKGISIEDMLTTIYEYYQEPIPPQELKMFREEGYEEPFNKRIDVMNNLVRFEGLTEIAPRDFVLNLGS